MLSLTMSGITKRYIGLQYVVSGATTTAGTVTAGYPASREFMAKDSNPVTGFSANVHGLT